MTAVVCVKCEMEMKPVKTGALVEEIAGTKPYKLWAGDAFKCEQCGAKVATGFGRTPVIEHFKADYSSSSEERFCRAFAKIEDKVAANERIPHGS